MAEALEQISAQENNDLNSYLLPIFAGQCIHL